MAASGGWAARPPLLRLGLIATAGIVVAILCVESVAWLGSGSAVLLIAPAADAVAFVVVASYCWLTTSPPRSANSPTSGLREARDGLAGGLGFLLAMTVADASSGDRVGLPGGLRLPLAIVAVLVAAGYAWVSIVLVSRQQEIFDLEAALKPDVLGEVGVRRPPLEAARVQHGLVGGVVAGVALTLYMAGASLYLFPFAGLVLIPAIATWAYAGLRTSRFDRRPLPKTSPDRPPRAFRTARLSAVAVLALAPVGVFWWVWLSVGTWGTGGVDVVLMATILVSVAAAVVYPFFTIAEALRTPVPELMDDRPLIPSPETIVASLDLANLRIPGRGTGAN